MAINAAGLRLQLCPAATNTGTMNSRGRKINDLQKWRRGWDTHPGLFAILACLQQLTWKPHGCWLFLRSRLLQLFQLFRINSTNFVPKQTPKTPSRSADHECREIQNKGGLRKGFQTLPIRRSTVYPY